MAERQDLNELLSQSLNVPEPTEEQFLQWRGDMRHHHSDFEDIVLNPIYAQGQGSRTQIQGPTYDQDPRTPNSHQSGSLATMQPRPGQAMHELTRPVLPRHPMPPTCLPPHMGSNLQVTIPEQVGTRRETMVQYQSDITSGLVQVYPRGGMSSATPGAPLGPAAAVTKMDFSTLRLPVQSMQKTVVTTRMKDTNRVAYSTAQRPIMTMQNMAAWLPIESMAGNSDKQATVPSWVQAKEVTDAPKQLTGTSAWGQVKTMDDNLKKPAAALAGMPTKAVGKKNGNDKVAPFDAPRTTRGIRRATKQQSGKKAEEKDDTFVVDKNIKKRGGGIKKAHKGRKRRLELRKEAEIANLRIQACLRKEKKRHNMPKIWGSNVKDSSAACTSTEPSSSSTEEEDLGALRKGKTGIEAKKGTREDERKMQKVTVESKPGKRTALMSTKLLSTVTQAAAARDAPLPEDGVVLGRPHNCHGCDFLNRGRKRGKEPKICHGHRTGLLMTRMGPTQRPGEQMFWETFLETPMQQLAQGSLLLTRATKGVSASNLTETGKESIVGSFQNLARQAMLKVISIEAEKQQIHHG